MRHSRSITNSSPLAAVWRLTLGLLLMCGIAVGSGAEPRPVVGLDLPLLVGQLEQAAIIGNPDKLRLVRPIGRTDTAGEGPDSVSLILQRVLDQPQAPALIYRRTTRSTAELPSRHHHLLPSPREPPLA